MILNQTARSRGGGGLQISSQRKQNKPVGGWNSSVCLRLMTRGLQPGRKHVAFISLIPPLYLPETHHLEARQLRAAPPSGGVSCSAAGAASGALLSPSSSVMSSCTLPSSSSSPMCSCWTSVRLRPSGLECRSSCSTSGSSPWCWRNCDR